MILPALSGEANLPQDGSSAICAWNQHQMLIAGVFQHFVEPNFNMGNSVLFLIKNIMITTLQSLIVLLN